MTRKRFVKILMATGCKRNKANEYARASRIFSVPYKNTMAIIAVASHMDRAMSNVDTMRL